MCETEYELSTEVPLLAKVALERTENDEVRVTLFNVRKLRLTYLTKHEAAAGASTA